MILQQAFVRSELGSPTLEFKRTVDLLLSTKRCRFQDSIQPLVRQYCSCPYFGMIVSQTISRQEKIVVVPFDTNKIQANRDGIPKSEIN